MNLFLPNLNNKNNKKSFLKFLKCKCVQKQLKTSELLNLVKPTLRLHGINQLK